jgi:hypothetical protein
MTAVPAFELSIASQQTTDFVDGRTQGYRIKMVCSPVRGFADGAVFLFQRQGEADMFSAICRPSDLVDFQIDLPDEKTGWFRSAEIDLVFGSKIEALEIQDEILAELKVLADEMAKINSDLSVISTIAITSDLTTDV